MCVIFPRARSFDWRRLAAKCSPAISRLQAGVDNQLNEEIELRELLSAIVDDARFEADAEGRSVQVESEIDGVVRGNVALLRRAVENAVRNAIKHRYLGGTVEMGATPGSAGRAAIISVRDSGTGVPESGLANIFDPFFRSSMHARKEGTGLIGDCQAHDRELRWLDRGVECARRWLRVNNELALLPG
jgi:K+-sensing histidine kinase KdpD